MRRRLRAEAPTGRIRHLPGGIDQYLAARQAVAQTPRVPAAATRDAGAPPPGAVLRSARKELARLERELDRLTAREAALHEQMAAAATDHARLRELNAQLSALAADRERAGGGVAGGRRAAGGLSGVLPPGMAEALALLCLASALAFAVVRPRGLPEVVIAAPAAVLLMATGVVSLDGAEQVLDDIGATVAFLAAVLALGELCARAGLFDAAGRWLAEGAARRPPALFGLVVVLCAAVTAVPSLDATVVFLTPVVFATVAVPGARPRPHAYACVHLANSASLLLPVSNLSNLLAFHATGLSFARFGALMALPWSAAIAVEWVALRRRFRGDLAAPATAGRPAAGRGIPVAYTASVLALTLAGFLASSWLAVDAALIAACGVTLLAAPALARRRITPLGLARAADPAFLAFVVALAIIVAGAEAHGLGDLVDAVTPSGAAFPTLLAIAIVAAVLANLVNNLPAILLMLPVLAPQGAGPVLAALIGVNIGPNLTYVGSLATLLWRRVLRRHGMETRPLEFLRLGALSVPPALILAVAALWISLRAGI